MWQKEFPDDNIVFKPLLGEGEESLSESKEDSNPVAVAVGADDEDIVSINKPQNPDEHSNNLHFVHQTKWQKKLLQKHGGEICMMDATYKTSRYALPLFFLCVKTNVDYIVVGSFVVQHEDNNSIMNGIRVLKEWNPSWNPH